ncbi:hypothetical protein DPQ33_06910 [Oceanidesulfovibrio indonesiensis]|uniref:DUF2975 domain-containing protein n=1 Tax=Oceanidesulfovibrio indonesiensis TaxID=54767 RepID=A0A7M3MHA1_9BACT|nr:DUF2975 domain-containing protein [Oceanidesulfovibrio indonesiensis]TVM18467.1 hypothetical protein DPQ33_06910 [Oceanidesulfovibrio indonesiensis]
MKLNAIRLSRIVYWLCIVGLVAAPALTALIFWNLEWVLEHYGPAMVLPFPVGQDINPGPVTATTRWLGFGVAAVPVALTCAMLWNLARLFGGYARGEVFTTVSVQRIRSVGLLLLVRELISPLIGAAMTVALTLSNPAGQRMVSVGLGSSNITMLITALMIIVVAYVMDQARELHEESMLTI